MIITIAHSKGGVGKSLLAWHLSVAMNVPIIDLDFQRTLVYIDQLRQLNGLSARTILHPQSTEEFMDVFKALDETQDIIIDVGGFDSDLNRMAIYLSDMIITPAVDRATEIAGLHKFHDVIQQISESTETDLKANILLNDVSPSARDFSLMEGMVAQFPHFKMMKSVVSHRADFYKTMNEGKGVSELPSSTKALDELNTLIAEIRKGSEE
ncbi:MAG: ParA family protein [Campylobacterales bacterium]|nr:ParA family protein [Campylobacterales bacterium]